MIIWHFIILWTTIEFNFLLLLKYNGFELWPECYNNNTSKSLVTLISVIRNFKEIWTLNFVVPMAASSYEWKALRPGLISFFNVILITRRLLAVFLRNPFF